MSTSPRLRIFALAPTTAAIFVSTQVTLAHAADICTAIALRDVAAVENPDSLLRKGEQDTAITQFNVDKKSGLTYFCSHGGYCYPTHVQVGGDLLEALKLQNCKVTESKAYDDGIWISYGVEPIRTAIPPETLRYNDLVDRLLQLGLCSACADNIAQYYLKKPESECAKTTLMALEGNPDAVKALVRFPEYCTWHY